MGIKDPFIDIAKHETNLKRSQLYHEIKNSLKSEAYDDSPIGHEFVAGYERQIPGMITAYVGDHSFLNNNEEENKRVIMEAVNAGMAIKVGLAVAIATLIYKILMVLMNNKSFDKDTGGGGRGSSTYKEAAKEAATTAVTTLVETRTEAIAVINANRSNPIHQEDDSPARVAVTNVATAIASNNNAPPLPANTAPEPYVVKEVLLVRPGNLTKLFALKDNNLFIKIHESANAMLKVVTANDISPKSMLGYAINFYSSHSSGSDASVAWFNKLVSSCKDIVKRITGEDIDDVSAMLQKMNDWITPIAENDTSYASILTNGVNAPPEYFDLETLSKKFHTDLDAPDSIVNRSMKSVEFNSAFIEKIVHNTNGYSDNEFWKSYIRLIENMEENKDKYKGSPDEQDKLYVQHCTSAKMVLQIVFEKVFKTVVVHRRSLDTIDVFIKDNTDVCTDLTEKFNKVIQAYNKDSGV